MADTLSLRERIALKIVRVQVRGVRIEADVADAVIDAILPLVEQEIHQECDVVRKQFVSGAEYLREALAEKDAQLKEECELYDERIELMAAELAEKDAHIKQLEETINQLGKEVNKNYWDVK